MLVSKILQLATVIFWTLPMDQDPVEQECSTSTVVPSVRTKQQYEQFKCKNNWMYASD